MKVTFEIFVVCVCVCDSIKKILTIKTKNIYEENKLKKFKRKIDISNNICESKRLN